MILWWCIESVVSWQTDNINRTNIDNELLVFYEAEPPSESSCDTPYPSVVTMETASTRRRRGRTRRDEPSSTSSSSSSVAAIQVVQVVRYSRAHDPWGPTSEDQIAVFWKINIKSFPILSIVDAQLCNASYGTQQIEQLFLCPLIGWLIKILVRFLFPLWQRIVDDVSIRQYFQL